jgi:hypothetical protein
LGYHAHKLRDLHGVISLATTDYKPYMLLFDRLHVFGLERYRLNNESSPEVDRINAEFDFLQAQGLIEALPLMLTEKISPDIHAEIATLASAEPIIVSGIRDVLIRSLADILPLPDSDVVPICETQLPELIKAPKPPSSSEVVLRVALAEMPIPDDTCAWQDILDFRIEKRGKVWDFRRFLHTLATKNQTEAEIRDDLDYSLNEYREAMKKRRLKIALSAVGACVIPAADLAFNFSGSHFASIAGAAVTINKLRIELLEGEQKAPGRECAYVFDARKRFGTGS